MYSFGFMQSMDSKDSSAVAAETLSNLSQAAAFQGHPNALVQAQQIAQHYAAHLPHVLASDPGPSSHPQGPPNLGQLSAAASAIQGAPGTRSQDGDDRLENGSADGAASGSVDGDGDGQQDKGTSKTGGRRGTRGATMTNDEWTRQRKDNHVSFRFCEVGSYFDDHI